jgi:hypothetical protein
MSKAARAGLDKTFAGGSSIKMRMRAAAYPVGIRAKPVITCAQCGETIHMARWSQYVDRWRVRYDWECEACGCNFGTLASFSRT